MHNYHIDSFTENCWCDMIDYSSLLDDGAPPPNFYESPLQPPSENVCMSIDIPLSEITTQEIKSEERGSPKKRGRSDLPAAIRTKACRERARRGKLNDRFLELSAILEPGRPVKTEKVVILSDAIRLLNQLKTESQEYTEMNNRLMEEIKTLKDYRGKCSWISIQNQILYDSGEEHKFECGPFLSLYCLDSTAYS